MSTEDETERAETTLSNEELAVAIDTVVEQICRTAGSPSPSKNYLDASDLDCIARCLRDGMTLKESVEDAWPRRDIAMMWPL